MKIAYFSDNAYPELSGIVDSIHTTGKELASMGHEVVFVGPYYSEKNYTKGKRYLVEEDGYEVVDGLRIIRLPSLPLPFSPTEQSRFAFPVGSSFRYLDSFKPDIIHTQSPYGVGFEAIRTARRYKVPLVGTNHTPIEEFYPWAPTMMRRFDAWYYNHCDFITAPYQGLIDNMRTVGLRSPGHAVPNPIGARGFVPATSEEKQALKKKYALPGPVLLYSGRLAPEKKINTILDALPSLLKKFPDLMFVATGHGSAEGELRVQARALGVEKNVNFVGFLSSFELISYYQVTDVFVVMSTAETFCMSMMQAFASGVPTVAARSRGLIDYCTPECGFLVEPGNSTALAQKIFELLENPGLRAQMGAAGVEYVKKFSPTRVAEAWEKIYQTVSHKQ